MQAFVESIFGAPEAGQRRTRVASAGKANGGAGVLVGRGGQRLLPGPPVRRLPPGVVAALPGEHRPAGSIPVQQPSPVHRRCGMTSPVPTQSPPTIVVVLPTAASAPDSFGNSEQPHLSA